MVKKFKTTVVFLLLLGITLSSCSCMQNTSNGSSSISQSQSSSIEPSSANEGSSATSLYTYSFEGLSHFEPSEGWTDFTISIPVPLDNYLSEDKNTFDLRKLASDFGWKEKDGAFYYSLEDMWVYFTLDHGISSSGVKQGQDCLWGCSYKFVKPDAPEENYYPFDIDNHAKTNNAEVHFEIKQEQASYLIDIESGIAADYKELVVILYMLTYVSYDVRYSPFSDPVFSSKCVTYPEYTRKTSQVDVYTF